MREIKFRTWDKKNKSMHSYDIDKDATFVVLPDGDVCQAGTSVEGGTGEHVWTVCDESNENFILMQYSGLLDKNGKEIYEGDIVRYLTPYRTYQSHYGEYIPTPDNVYVEPLEPEIKESVKEVVFSNGAFVVKTSEAENNYEMNLCYANKEWILEEIKQEINFREGREDMEYLLETYGLENEEALVSHVSGCEIIGNIYENPPNMEETK